jgi:hypothetical protein
MTKSHMSHTHEEIRAQNTHSRVTEKEANRSWARSRAHS